MLSLLFSSFKQLSQCIRYFLVHFQMLSLFSFKCLLQFIEHFSTCFQVFPLLVSSFKYLHNLLSAFPNSPTMFVSLFKYFHCIFKSFQIALLYFWVFQILPLYFKSFQMQPLNFSAFWNSDHYLNGQLFTIQIVATIGISIPNIFQS